MDHLRIKYLSPTFHGELLINTVIKYNIFVFIFIHKKPRFVIQNKFKQRKDNRKGMSLAKDPNLMYNMKLICMWPISLHFH